MNNQLHNQIKQLSDRELLEGIYQMLLVVMQEQLISDSKQLGINVIADLLVDNMYRNRERNENNNNAPFVDGKFIYDQRLNTTEPWLFAVFNDKGSIAYNSRNSNGKTYIDGTLNESTIVSALLNKKQIITIVNNDVTGDKTKTPIFFSNTDHNSGWISSAFYNSFGFDSVPTKQNDGFTEQDLIDYVLENLITK